jgi:arsenate reductase-like glutaredoxin family protein
MRTASFMRSTTTRPRASTAPRSSAGRAGWETLLNRAGTTFRKLPEKDKQGLTEKKATTLMAAQPSMIKRPVLDIGGTLLVGFQPGQYEKAFGARR